MALEDKELPADSPADPEVEELIKARLRNGRLPCVSAFTIAEELGVPPIEIGRTADQLGVRLTLCQLGFFGYPNKQAWDQEDYAAMPVPAGLADAIREATTDAGVVSCAQLWSIAADFGVPRLQIGFLADELGVHVTPCQLGAF